MGFINKFLDLLSEIVIKFVIEPFIWDKNFSFNWEITMKQFNNKRFENYWRYVHSSWVHFTVVTDITEMLQVNIIV